jgi:uncharacterized membrane protein YccF (DUF307 family)
MAIAHFKLISISLLPLGKQIVSRTGTWTEPADPR